MKNALIEHGIVECARLQNKGTESISREKLLFLFSYFHHISQVITSPPGSNSRRAIIPLIRHSVTLNLLACALLARAMLARALMARALMARAVISFDVRSSETREQRT